MASEDLAPQRFRYFPHGGYYRIGTSKGFDLPEPVRTDADVCRQSRPDIRKQVADQGAGGGVDGSASWQQARQVLTCARDDDM
ncbi:hypothetical protein [Actinoplanes lobatus]|uniref:Uncharacterized protein n=1 Tax=Actinoplanes lobatus TaxID=113568 RepID=A0A7W7HRK7_9ACTN|nr:hypothetical protein [Actinoplanes lobatus]MBB4755182.1 hypothetical protein [Actinoplanes lobatus]